MDRKTDELAKAVMDLAEQAFEDAKTADPEQAVEALTLCAKGLLEEYIKLVYSYEKLLRVVNALATEGDKDEDWSSKMVS